MMSALQIYVWEVQHSSGLARSYAYNHIDLYLMVMGHLGKTYCKSFEFCVYEVRLIVTIGTADLQHNLFVEALKVIKGGASTLESDLNGSVNRAKAIGMDLPSSGLDTTHDNSLMHGSLEDFFLSFNPFMGLPMQPDELR